MSSGVSLPQQGDDILSKIIAYDNNLKKLDQHVNKNKTLKNLRDYIQTTSSLIERLELEDKKQRENEKICGLSASTRQWVGRSVGAISGLGSLANAFSTALMNIYQDDDCIPGQVITANVVLSIVGLASSVTLIFYTVVQSKESEWEKERERKLEEAKIVLRLFQFNEKLKLLKKQNSAVELTPRSLHKRPLPQPQQANNTLIEKHEREMVTLAKDMKKVTSFSVSTSSIIFSKFIDHLPDESRMKQLKKEQKALVDQAVAVKASSSSRRSSDQTTASEPPSEPTSAVARFQKIVTSKLLGKTEPEETFSTPINSLHNTPNDSPTASSALDPTMADADYVDHPESLIEITQDQTQLNDLRAKYQKNKDELNSIFGLEFIEYYDHKQAIQFPE